MAEPVAQSKDIDASEAARPVSLSVRDLRVSYGDVTALDGISLDVPRNEVTAFIGPSGCGKSTLLRSFNRMNELIEGVTTSGSVKLDGAEVYDPGVDLTDLRRRVGIVFQRPNPFPKTVFENVAYGLRIHGDVDKADIPDRVEWALRSAALWDEVKDRLRVSALELSGGQQQRLVIARAIAIRPSVLLLDEPASSLDPISTLKIEELINQLKTEYSIVIVTHNMQQAARVSDNTAFLYLGQLIEFDETVKIFRNPGNQQTEDYITGRYG
ncbi:MAG: phosphate ABC transporter ATP-binding protein PstB [Pseudomonadota bacterium]